MKKLHLFAALIAFTGALGTAIAAGVDSAAPLAVEAKASEQTVDLAVSGMT